MVKINNNINCLAHVGQYVQMWDGAFQMLCRWFCLAVRIPETELEPFTQDWPSISLCSDVCAGVQVCLSKTMCRCVGLIFRCVYVLFCFFSRLVCWCVYVWFKWINKCNFRKLKLYFSVFLNKIQNLKTFVCSKWTSQELNVGHEPHKTNIKN